MNKIKLTEDRWIGESEFPFIIAEIGNNHNGDLNLAFKMIKIAKEIGVDAVKFQVKNIEKCFSQELLDSTYVNENSFGNTYREHKQALEFSEQQLKQIYDYAKKLDIVCFSTPFDVDSVDLLEKIGNPIYKISSFHVTDLPLIERVCKTKKPIILSTGMSTIDEIDKAVNLIRKHTAQYSINHCVSSYPTADGDINLNVIKTLQDRYKCPVGYSGHETCLVTVCLVAVGLGATSIERHISLDRSMYGSDQSASVETKALRNFVTAVKAVPDILGNGEKVILDTEISTREKLRIEVE